MQSSPSSGPRRMLRIVGSLWFAAILLVLLLVAMACATVFESMHGTERAFRVFYMSWWFTAFLVLLGVNVLGALAARYPFTRKRAGFVITHVSILLVLGGALVTKHYGEDGQAALFEGQTVESFGVRGEAILSIVDRLSDARSEVDLDARAFGGFVAVDEPNVSPANLGNLRVTVERYVPDSQAGERVVNDSPEPQLAVEVSLSPSAGGESTWLFAGERRSLGSLPIGFRLVADEEEFARLLSPDLPEAGDSVGIVEVEFGGSTLEVPVEECMDRPAPLADTGQTVRVLRYLPHASVGSDGKVTSLSDHPVNPAIEVELVGPEGSRKQLAFSKFPDFQSMHGSPVHEEVKITFRSQGSWVPDVPVELLGGPEGELYVRIARTRTEVESQEVRIGEPIPLPWGDSELVVSRRYDRARTARIVEPVDPVREKRIPAILLALTTPDETRKVWVQKYDRPLQVSMGDTPFQLSYSDKSLPLGFRLTLNRFRIGYYPGENRPRSFESHVTIVDPVTGRTLSRVVSMNSPVDYGRYSLFQSSYRQVGERMMSFLSVSRDPGQTIVYTGYVAMMIGMLVVLATRIVDHRRKSTIAATGDGDEITELAPGIEQTDAVMGADEAGRSTGDRLGAVGGEGTAEPDAQLQSLS